MKPVTVVVAAILFVAGLSCAAVARNSSTGGSSSAPHTIGNGSGSGSTGPVNSSQTNETRSSVIGANRLYDGVLAQQHLPILDLLRYPGYRGGSDPWMNAGGRGDAGGSGRPDPWMNPGASGRSNPWTNPGITSPGFVSGDDPWMNP